MKTEDIDAAVRFDFPETGKIIIGLSGGADSVLLTHLLLRKYGAERLLCVHVNHGIRGAEADRDEIFVREFCAQRGLSLRVFRKDIPKLAQESGESEEECARRIRYECFGECVSAPDDCIATAHNADDNAETMLLNLTRGMGPGGADGIPARRGRIRRPLLHIPREEIERCCAAFGLSYVTDSTNETDLYTRNKIRHSVIPVLKSVNPQLTQAVSRFAESMALQNDFVESEARALLERAECPGGLSLAVLRRAHRAVLRAALELKLASLGRLGYVHLTEAERCVLYGGAVTLPGGAQLSARQDTLTVTFGKPEAFSVAVTGEKTVLPNGKRLIISKKFINNAENSPKIHNLLFKNLLDCDRITEVTVVRTRRAGDRFAPFGRGVTKPVKKLFNELRIPAAVRDEVLLLELGGQIIWIEGAGAAEGYRLPDAGGWAFEIKAEIIEAERNGENGKHNAE